MDFETYWQQEMETGEARIRQALMQLQLESSSDLNAAEYELWENGFYVYHYAGDNSHFFAPRQRNGNEVATGRQRRNIQD